MANYLGKAIVDGNPQQFVLRPGGYHGSHQTWRCSENIDIPAGNVVLKVSNWKFRPETAAPLFDVHEDVRVGLGWLPITVDGIPIPIPTPGFDRTILRDVGDATNPMGRSFNINDHIKIYFGNVRSFTGPFFVHAFSANPGEALPLPGGYYW